MCNCQFIPGKRVEYIGLAKRGKLGTIVEGRHWSSGSVFVRFDDERSARAIRVTNIKLSDQPKVKVGPARGGLVPVTMDYSGATYAPNPVKQVDPDKDRVGKYLLWSPTGITAPSVLHASLDEAQEVAETMANRHGGVFYIAKLVGARRLPKAKVEVL